MKLNLGSGSQTLEGYENIDRMFGTEVYPLNVPDNSCDEIRASHVLEHFGYKEAFAVLRHWVSKLKPGGVLKIAVPDLRKVAEQYLNRKDGEHVKTGSYLMGGQVDENDYHKSCYDRDTMTQYMRQAGLSDIEPWTSEIQDCASLPISLNLCGRKVETKTVQLDTSKIHAVMSVPRLGFTQNHKASLNALVLPFHIQIHQTEGVYWDQCLTRGIEEAITQGAELIFTMDYDTWMRPAHVKAMLAMMLEHPEADAIIPMQAGREKRSPLVGTESGVLTEKDMQEQLIAARTGHFGFTLFKVDALRRLKKPWFLPVPAPDGSWNEGRQDSDIAFWNRWHEQGFKAFLAPQIHVGHLQLVCTFMGSAENNYEPVHVYLHDLDAGNYPAHCVPQI